VTPETEAQHPQTLPERLFALALQSEALRRLVAKNPGAPPALLLSLSTHPDKLTLANLAENPNTPLAALFQVGAFFPLSFLKNPVIHMLLLEDPLFLRAAPPDFLGALLSVKEPPRWVLEAALLHRSSSVITKLGSCKGLPREFIERLVNHRETAARASVAARKHLAVPSLLMLAKDKELSVRAAVAANPSAPASLLEDLFAEPASEIWKALASNPSAPPSVLKELATVEEHSTYELFLLQLSVAQNPSAPASVLTTLSKNTNNRELLIAISKNPNSPAHLRKLPARVRRILRRGEWH
jgi:hypothetical protein